MTFTAWEKYKEASREVSYRQFVYSKKVAEGKMTEADAKRKIAIMVEITEEYAALAVADEPELF